MKNPQRKKLIQDSTRELFKLHGFRNLADFLHAYYYLSRIDQYVRILLPILRGVVKWMPRSKADTFRPLLAYVPDRYHAKVIPLEEARRLVSVNKDVHVPPELSKKIIPFEIANQIVIRHPESIAVIDCACRRFNRKSCQPENVCMMIGEPYASFVMEHAKGLHPRKISQEEAVTMLEDCHKRGWVHNAYFKDVLGSQFYAICNCCPCCCGGIEVHKSLKSILLKESIQELAPSGYLAIVNRKKCTGCGTCVATCPFAAISMREEHAVIDPVLCMGCGVCPDSCTEKAIRLQLSARQGIPLDVHRLVPQKEARP